MKLYKFQTVNDKSIDALENFKLYFATSEKLNDPTESMFSLLDFDPKDAYSPDVSSIYEIGILSMAVGDDSLIEESPFMWAHYGNELKGFCLAFDFDMFLRGIAQHVEQSGHVKYRKFPRLLAGDNLINEASGLENVAGNNFRNHNLKRIYDVCFFDKPSDFEKEREFRFITQQSGLKPYNPESLVKIIIGEKMSDTDYDKLFSVLSRLGIEHKVRTATVKRNSFKIHINSSVKEL